MIQRRYLITFIAAAAITFGLFWLMQFLISMKSGLYDDSKKGRLIEFVRLKRESDLELKKRKLPDKQEAEEEPPPPDADERILSQRVLGQALDRLPDGYRQVLVMHDVEGMTHEEIAARLGVAVGTSKSQLHKARARMRDLLAPPMGRNEAGNHA